MVDDQDRWDHVVRRAVLALVARHGATATTIADEAMLQRDLEEEFRLMSQPPRDDRTRQPTSWRCRVLQIDIALGPVGRRISTGIECKAWQESTSKRNETLWDAAKLASLILDGVVERGYLVSTGASAIWRRPDDAMTRLFEDGCCETLPLITYSTSWWGKCGGARVPSRLRCRHIAQAELPGDQEVRAARIEPLGSKLVDVPVPAPKGKPRWVAVSPR